MEWACVSLPFEPTLMKDLRSWLPRAAATYGILLILGCILIFHVCVLLGLAPSEMVWGARIERREQLFGLEAISILLNLFMMAVVLSHSGILDVFKRRGFVRGALWGMAILFLLYTLGNAFPPNEAERLLFTPHNFVLAVFSVRLAVE